MKGRKGKVLRWKDLPVRWVIVLGIAGAFLPSLSAQAVTSTTTSDVISQMRSFRGQWMTNVWTYARNLFWLLAFIEFAWSAIALALDKTDLQCWMAGLVRKLMWIGAFYALLQNGSTWIPAIIDSFELIGAGAAAGPQMPSRQNDLAQNRRLGSCLERVGAKQRGFFRHGCGSYFAGFDAICSFRPQFR